MFQVVCSITQFPKLSVFLSKFRPEPVKVIDLILQEDEEKLKAEIEKLQHQLEEANQQLRNTSSNAASKYVIFINDACITAQVKYFLF